jgi:hemerythrin-like domain-containing protein
MFCIGKSGWNIAFLTRTIREDAMNYTEQLKKEHEGIMLMLRILGKMCDKLEAGEPVDTGHMKSSVEFLKVFADTCHHAKEEERLFPAMERAGIPKEGGPIGVMLQEHEMGRAYVIGLADAVEDYASGNNRRLSGYC